MKYLYNIKKYQSYLIVGCLLIILIMGYLWASRVTAKNEVQEKNDFVNKEEIKESTKKIMVDIKGEVQKPNVYELDIDSRVIDLIKKAGGLTKEANTDIINLSQKLADQTVIIIYSNEEMKNFKKEEKSKYSIQPAPIKCPDILNSGCIDTKLNSSTSNNLTSDKKGITDNLDKEKNDTNIIVDSNQNKDFLVNINEATKEELLTLSGIGESKAESIIEYRLEHGKFERIEEIKNVTGIGESIYEKIKNHLTV